MGEVEAKVEEDSLAGANILVPISAELIVVTFNGIEYRCPAMKDGPGYFYGEISSSGDPDFTNYPFAIASSMETQLVTAAAGTYSVKIEAYIESVETTTEFGKARCYWTETSTEEIFSETVTTAESDGFTWATLSYNGTIASEQITVLFDDTEYTCQRTRLASDYFYGGFSTHGPTFEEYPFCLRFGSKNAIYTQTVGEHTVSVIGEVSTSATSDEFANAVNNCVEVPDVNVLFINQKGDMTDKSWQEINNAFKMGTLCIVNGYGLVLQMWHDDNAYVFCMATGATGTMNGAFDPAIWRTSNNRSISPMSFYKYNSQMP